MISKEKMRLDVKWATRQRLQYIEVMAWYTGVVTRSDVAKAFGQSDPAATKDLKLYSDLAPGNLVYNHSVFGFVPGEGFSAVFADLAPAAALPVIAANLAVANGPYGSELIYGLPTASLPLPARLPSRRRWRRSPARSMVGASCASATARCPAAKARAARVLEPHTLVNTGLRWHVRAYSEDTCDFRDFVLSRITEAVPGRSRPNRASSTTMTGWKRWPASRAACRAGCGQARKPAAGLRRERRGHRGERAARAAGLCAAAPERRHHAGSWLNPNAYQLMLLNRDEIEPFAAWAFY
jgi:hypothetical protein